MNMDKIKAFISIRKELKDEGVIGVNILVDEVHVDKDALVGEADLQFKPRPCNQYPYMIFTVKDDIKLFCILTRKEVEILYPEFSGYMVEDVDLSGGEKHVS